jgi:N-acetylmuramoyl-L-alanine amidase
MSEMKFKVLKPDEAPIPKRMVDSLVIHHSASGRSTTPWEIEKWHKARGFREIGYHFVIIAQGNVYFGRDIEKIPASVKGHNKGTIAVCCSGNFSEMRADTPFHPQFIALGRLVNVYVDAIPGLKIVGHRELANTECPGLNVDLDRMRAYFRALKNLEL